LIQHVTQWNTIRNKTDKFIAPESCIVIELSFYPSSRLYGVTKLTEEKSFPRRKPSKLTTIRGLSSDITDPVRIMGIVVDVSPGLAVVQDIYDDVKNAGKIQVSFEGSLELSKRYLFIGEVTEKTTESGKELRFNASLAHNIDKLDVALYREVREMEEKVTKAMSG
jgi:hypothetical protein